MAGHPRTVPIGLQVIWLTADSIGRVIGMRTYETPELRALGQMSDVTRKTGAAPDFFADTFDDGPADVRRGGPTSCAGRRACPRTSAKATETTPA